LPGEIKILAQQKDKVNIELEYNNVTFDEDLSFPYEIPQGYDKITIDAP
jgi:outer membrane lipoprotein-sorting protein